MLKTLTLDWLAKIHNCVDFLKMADDIEDVSFLPGLYIHYCFIKALDIEYRMTELCVHEQSI